MIRIDDSACPSKHMLAKHHHGRLGKYPMSIKCTLVIKNTVHRNSVMYTLHAQSYCSSTVLMLVLVHYPALGPKWMIVERERERERVSLQLRWARVKSIMACSRSEHVLAPAHIFCYISLYTRRARSVTSRRNVRAHMSIMRHAKPAVHTSQRQGCRTWVITLLFQCAEQSGLLLSKFCLNSNPFWGSSRSQLVSHSSGNNGLRVLPS